MSDQRGVVATAALAAADEHRVPGLALSVWHQGEEVERTCAGVTSLEHPLEINPETLFQIGSITKTFTALAVGILAERGAVELDAPVRACLPDLRLRDEAVAAAVTPRHLLTHSAGWQGDFFEDTGNDDDALARLVERMDELPQVLPLGAEFSYSNSGFSLLGRLIEVASGMPYEKFIADEILDPLGMDRSGFGADYAITRRPAIGHVRSRGRTLVARPWAIPRASYPLGGLVASLDDLVTYARFQLGESEHAGPDADRELVPRARIVEMHKPQRPAGSIADQVGLSWMLEGHGGYQLVLHTGGMNGQIAGLYLAPTACFALVVLTNGDWGNQVLVAAKGTAVSEYLGLSEDESVLPQPEQDELDQYVGDYESTEWIWRIKRRRGRLWLQAVPNHDWLEDLDPAPEPVEPAGLTFRDHDRVVVLEPGRMYQMAGEFGRDESGQLKWLRFDGRISLRR